MDNCDGNKETYLCMEIAKVSGPDLEGFISDSINYEAKINHIEIPHGRNKRRTEAYAEGEQSILRSELRRLMWVSRLRDGARFTMRRPPRKLLQKAKLAIGENEIGAISNSQGGEKGRGRIGSYFEHIPGYRELFE